MTTRRARLWLYALLSLGCCFETIGCPQLLGNALRDGTRSYLDIGLTAALLAAVDLQGILGLPGS